MPTPLIDRPAGYISEFDYPRHNRLCLPESLNDPMVAINKHYAPLLDSIRDRLTALVGDNPDVDALLTEFENAINVEAADLQATAYGIGVADGVRRATLCAMMMPFE